MSFASATINGLFPEYDPFLSVAFANEYALLLPAVTVALYDCSNPVEESAIVTLVLEAPLSNAMLNVSVPSTVASSVIVNVFVFEAGVKFPVSCSLFISALDTPVMV